MKKGFRIIKFKKDKPVFQVKDISKSFDGRPILKKISMHVHKSEIVGVLGPNGCGKSTLYGVCVGEHRTDNGKIILNNKELQDLPIHLRAKMGLGYLPQQRSLFDMSVYDNIFGICQICIKDTDKQISTTEKLLDEFNLQHLRSLNASVLSGGERARVALSRVMINNPKVILLDEVLSNLDPIVVQDIQKYILKIQNSGVAILITDHQVRNLFEIVDRAYITGEHQIIGEGTPNELMKNSKAVEQYFGNQFN